MAKSGNTNVLQGEIKRIVVGKGFGFIGDDTGVERFFHMSAVIGCSFSDLAEGDKVTFTIGDGPKGPRAETVRKV